MKFLVPIVAFMAVAFARPGPDVSHITGGYDYQPPSSSIDYKLPSTSYGVPLQSVGSHEVPTGSYLPGQDLPKPDSHVDFSSSHYQLNYNKEENLYVPSVVQNQKRVYYFASPEQDEEQGRLRINIVPSHQKNTNVIFVKAPHYNPPTAEVHAPPSHIEDKTKVVVLVKKPEELAPVNIPAPPPVKHGKPEVLVVKYKDQHEAERAVAANSGVHAVGANIHQVGDEHTFVKTLENDHIPQIGLSVSSGLYESSGSLNSGLSGSGPILTSGSGAILTSGSDDGGSSLSSSLEESFGISGGADKDISLGSSKESSKESSHSGGLKVTIEATGSGVSGSSSISSSESGSSHSSSTLEDDSLFSKYGPPKESGPYVY